MSTIEPDELAEIRKIARANSEAVEELMRSPKQLSIKVRPYVSTEQESKSLPIQHLTATADCKMTPELERLISLLREVKELLGNVEIEVVLNTSYHRRLRDEA